MKFKKIRELLNLINITDKYDKMNDDQISEIYYNCVEIGAFQIEVDAIDTRYNETSIRKILDTLGLPLDGKSRLVFPNGQKTRNPVLVGLTNILRLEFFAEEKAKATSASSKSDEMILGRGQIKASGQKIGQQEYNCLSARGVQAVVDHLSGISAKNHQKEIQQQLNVLGVIIQK